MANGGQADARSRAMGILVTYLATKLNINSDVIGSPVVTGRNKFSPARFKQLCAGTYPLPAEQFLELREHVKRYLDDHRTVIIQDYEWIRPLLITVDLDEYVNPKLVNQVQSNQVALDLEFLRAMNIDPDDHRHRSVYSLLRGFWYVIRQSTDDVHPPAPVRYNVSLLSVKPTAYPVWNAALGRTLESRSLVPHFSVRSPIRERGRGTHQTFRGRVVEMDGTVYFIGDRGHGTRPKVFVMAWATPFVAASARPDFAQGVIMTVTSGDITAVGPVVCRYVHSVDEAAEMNRLRAERGDEWGKELSEWYDRQVAELSRCVGAHTEQELQEKLRLHEPDVPGLLSVLKEELARGGYYEVQE